MRFPEPDREEVMERQISRLRDRCAALGVDLVDVLDGWHPGDPYKGRDFDSHEAQQLDFDAAPDVEDIEGVL